ncbi:MAG: T9SS type A sorting domain-containing protein [Bacteroidota bacterium]
MRILALLLISAALYLSPVWIFGQSKPDPTSIVREILKEKVRIQDWTAFQEAYMDNLTKGNDEETPAPPYPLFMTDSSQGPLSGQAETESEIHAAVNPTDPNNLIVSAMQQDPTSTTNPLLFPTYYTNDLGVTWQKSSFQGAHPTGDLVGGGGDPIIAFTSDGTAHITWLLLSLDNFPFSLDGTIGLYYGTSTDGGQTWNVQDDPIVFGKPTLSLFGGVTINDRFVDKQWMAVDRSTGQYADNLYMAYFDVSVSPDTALTMQLLTKPAGQDSFLVAPVQVNTQSFANMQFASIDVGLDGVVHVSFWGTFDGVNLSLYHAESLDGGATFQPENKISDFAFPFDSVSAAVTLDVIGVDRLYPCPHIVIDKSSGPHAGNIYAAWTAYGLTSQTTEGLDIYYSRSTDGGDTWSPAVVLNDDPNDSLHQFFPSLHVSDQGTLLIGWYDRRDDPGNAKTHFYMTTSTDGGQSFTPQLAVSSQESDHAVIGDNNGGFGVGEYTQVVSSGSLAIPIWADGRTNDGNINIYAAFIDLNTPATGLERLNSLQDGLSLEVLPNPVEDQLNLKLALQKPLSVEIKVSDISGRELLVKDLSTLGEGEHRFSFSAADWAPGLYFVTVLTQKGYALQRFQVK